MMEDFVREYLNRNPVGQCNNQGFFSTVRENYTDVKANILMPRWEQNQNSLSKQVLVTKNMPLHANVSRQTLR